MKLAFISDIHANLPALRAVLEDIEKQRPDDIYCLGDLVNFAGWDNEVIELIRKHGITCVQGNHDQGIGYSKTDFPFSSSTDAQKKFGHDSIYYVNKTITDSNRAYLSNLPFILQLQFRFPFQSVSLAMTHGSISSNNEYVSKETPDEYLLEMMDTIHTDILLMGHTHIPHHRAIYCEEENKKLYKHAINVGSVGKPKGESNKSCYCLVNIDHQTDLSNPAFVNVHFQYVQYDVKEVIKHIHTIGLSDAYNDFLLKV
jgi:putative phosphoesterase